MGDQIEKEKSKKRPKRQKKFSLNKFYPWLKLAVPVLTAFFVILGIRGIFFGRINEKTIIPKTPMSYQVKVPERIFRGNLIGKKLVALTFDDGPSAITTPQLLDILEEKKAVATFFELGRLVEINSEVTKRVVEQGSEVGSHTYSHKNLIRERRGVVEEDKEETDGVFKDVLGVVPRLTRPPYGNCNETVAEILDSPLILWSVDSRDWESRDPEKIEEIAIDRAEDGSIILFHDIYQTTVDSIPEIIDKLREDGFEFVTVSELAELRGEELKNGEEYRAFYSE